MLGEVASNKDNEIVKDKKVRYLPPQGVEDSGYNPYESELLEVHYGTPKRSLTTARLSGYLRGFRINLSVVCPNPEKAKNRLTLTRREGDDITKAMNNLVETLIKHAFGEDLKI